MYACYSGHLCWNAHFFFCISLALLSCTGLLIKFSLLNKDKPKLGYYLGNFCLAFAIAYISPILGLHDILSTIHGNLLGLLGLSGICVGSWSLHVIGGPNTLFADNSGPTGKSSGKPEASAIQPSNSGEGTSSNSKGGPANSTSITPSSRNTTPLNIGSLVNWEHYGPLPEGTRTVTAPLSIQGYIKVVPGTPNAAITAYLSNGTGAMYSDPSTGKMMQVFRSVENVLIVRVARGYVNQVD